MTPAELVAAVERLKVTAMQDFTDKLKALRACEPQTLPLEKTFHLERFVYESDGKFAPFKYSREVGDILRPSGSYGTFADMVILGFTEDGDVRMARPYVYASGVGTTGPTALTGVEVYTIFASGIVNYTLVGKGMTR